MNNIYHQDIYQFNTPVSSYWKGLPKKFIFPQLRIFYFRLAMWFYAIKDKLNI